jgi:hypothetical protein
MVVLNVIMLSRVILGIELPSVVSHSAIMLDVVILTVNQKCHYNLGTYT